MNAPRRLSIGPLVISAAVSSAIVSWAVAIEDLGEGLVSLLRPDAVPPGAGDLIQALPTLVFAPLWGIVFGTIAATIFLAPALLASSGRSGALAHMLAGGMASTAWIVCGLFARRLPDDYWTISLQWVGAALSLEAFAGRWEATLAVIVGGMIAGPVAGWAYWRMVRAAAQPFS